MIILPLLVLLLSYLVVYLSINSQKPRVAQYAKSAPPVLLIAWIIATCFIGNRYSIPSINIFLNIICIIAIVIGVFYMRDGRKLGFYSIVASSLLHISNSFLTKYDIETNVFIIIVDAFLILLLVLIVFLKNRNGNRWFDVMSFYSEPSIKTSFLRYYNILSIITFVFIMFVFPTYRSLHDDVRYFKTYYNEYDFYDNEGEYSYFKYLSVFSHLNKDKFEIKQIGGNYYHVRPKEYYTNDVAPISEDGNTLNNGSKPSENQYTESSSANAMDYQFTTKEEQCGLCHGENKCIQCDGLGMIWMDFFNKYIPCSLCAHTLHPGLCPTCDGKGVITHIYVNQDKHSMELNTFLYQHNDILPILSQSPYWPLNNNSFDASKSIEHECIDCHGLKKCPNCGGRTFKQVESWDGYTEIPCSYCNQTGHCPTCHGLGKQYYL